MPSYHTPSSFNLVHMDASYIYRNGVAASLISCSSINLIASLSSFEALEKFLLSETDINVVLCEIFDASNNIAKSIKIIRRMIKKHPGINFILLTGVEKNSLLMQCHAHGYLFKKMQIDDMINIISVIQNSRLNFFDCGSYEKELTEKELSILISFCHTPEMKQVCLTNDLSYNYISYVKRCIMKKLSLKNNLDFLSLIVFMTNTPPFP
ncbi:hypothetical protein AB1D50_004110 [Enterobacter hormaechei]